MTVTFTPFGVPCEYSCRGWRPIGSSFSCVAPAIGRLMFSNLPPLGFVQVQTLGGVYSGVSVIAESPGGSRGQSAHLTRQVGRRARPTALNHIGAACECSNQGDARFARDVTPGHQPKFHHLEPTRFSPWVKTTL